MNRIVLAIALVLTITTSAFAREVTFEACTADSKVSSLRVELEDTATTKAESEVKDAFTKAAGAMTAEDLSGHPGYVAFISNLTQAAKDAIAGIYGPPAVVEGKNCSKA